MANRGGRRAGAGRPLRDPDVSRSVGLLVCRHRNDFKKVTAAVKHTAELLGCGDRTVWNCWMDLDRLLQVEKYEYDFLMDAVHDWARKEAVSSLRAEHGPEKEFSVEEIKERKTLLEEEWAELNQDF